MNPTFVNNAHRDLHLWPPKSIELILLAWLICLAKFNEEAHNGLVSILFTSVHYKETGRLICPLWPAQNQ